VRHESVFRRGGGEGLEVGLCWARGGIRSLTSQDENIAWREEPPRANGEARAPPTRINRLQEVFKRRIKIQIALPSAKSAAMLFWALLLQRAGRSRRSTARSWPHLISRFRDAFRHREMRGRLGHAAPAHLDDQAGLILECSARSHVAVCRV